MSVAISDNPVLLCIGWDEEEAELWYINHSQSIDTRYAKVKFVFAVSKN